MRRTRGCLPLLFLITICGCNSGDRRLTEVSREAANRQAQQNTLMAKLQDSVTSMQHDLQRSQAEVGRQRDLLEGERREIADQRFRDPIIAATIMDVGLVLACLLPLLLAAYVLHCLRDPGQTDSVVTEVLVQEIVAEKPLLLPPARSVAAISHEAGPQADDTALPK